MLWMYDKVIADDLRRSINPDNMDSSPIKVIGVDQSIGVIAQIKNDEIEYPVLVLTRDENTTIDSSRTNFTQIHNGVRALIDNKTNELYYERAIPITLKYSITILTTNMADADEIAREIVFKYMDMYFISFTLPYESKRKVRIGVNIDSDAAIERSSATTEYFSGGSLYQTIVPLSVEGAVLIDYNPAKLQRTEYELELKLKE